MVSEVGSFSPEACNQVDSVFQRNNQSLGHSPHKPPSLPAKIDKMY